MYKNPRKQMAARIFDAAFVLGVASASLAYDGISARLEQQADAAESTISYNTTTDSTAQNLGQVSETVPPMQNENASICEALKSYPKLQQTELSFRSAAISNLCKPFVKQTRAELDRCGVKNLDPYTSRYTWPSRNQLAKRGKGNLYVDPQLQSELAKLPSRIESIRSRATELCCAPGETACREGMAKVEVEVCKPNSDPTQPDPCVFGGSFHMPGSAYRSIFEVVAKAKGEGEATEMRKIAMRNLARKRNPASATHEHGKITLSSYVPLSSGIAAAEPVLLHEFGHACSMVRMRNAAVTQPRDIASGKRAARATEWIDSARKRCDTDFKIPEATYDFWTDIGESKELAVCLNDLAGLNQRQEIDKPCSGICPGHYVEEAVGIAFSLLLGDLKDGASSILPNTCDHVRDGQHPLVSDVVECFAQHSPRFRSRVKQAYGCTEPTAANLAQIAHANRQANQ
ncbi:MAG: hypothetical protein V4692_12565 [Bdellovibrionota bacterium]